MTQDDSDEPPKADIQSLRGMPNFARLEQRVTSIEESLRDIKTDFKTIRDEISLVHHAVLSFGKPQYSVIAVVGATVLGATGGLWALAIAPVNADLSRLYAVTDKGPRSMRVSSS
jgi:hypothetical protein